MKMGVNFRFRTISQYHRTNMIFKYVGRKMVVIFLPWHVLPSRAYLGGHIISVEDGTWNLVVVARNQMCSVNTTIMAMKACTQNYDIGKCCRRRLLAIEISLLLLWSENTMFQLFATLRRKWTFCFPPHGTGPKTFSTSIPFTILENRLRNVADSYGIDYYEPEPTAKSLGSSEPIEQYIRMKYLMIFVAIYLRNTA